MPEFGGLWKYQNNPALTKSVCLNNVGHHMDELHEEKPVTVYLDRLQGRLLTQKYFPFEVNFCSKPTVLHRSAP